MPDSSFRNTTFILPEGWKIYSSGGVVGNHKFKPDISIKDSNDKFSCIIESTSTNDRKVGLGEMLLAEKLFTDEGVRGKLVFSLCGNSTSPPRPETQIEYIRPYFEFLKKSNNKTGVCEIHFIYESDFNCVNWALFSDEFNSKSLKLCV